MKSSNGCAEVRVFITGSSLFTGYGDATATVEGMRRGASAVRHLPELESLGLPGDIGAPVPGSPSAHPARYWARQSIDALLAATPLPRRHIALAAAIGWEAWDRETYRCWTSGTGTVPPLLPAAPGTAEAGLHREFGLGGPLACSHSACAASTQCLAEAVALLESGQARACIAGGSDDRLHPAGIIGYARLGALASDTRLPPEARSRPFDAGHCGFVIGAGAGFLLLEAARTPEDLSSPALGEILATASTCDAFRLTDPDPEGREIRACIETALEAAGLRPGDIDLVSTHGTGTPANDQAEANALRQVFTPASCSPLGLALKSLFGHCAMASGAVELAATLAAVRAGFLPPVLNLERPIAEAEPLRWVRSPGTPPPRHPVLLKNSFGFGGQNSCVILRIHTLDGDASGV